MVVKTRILTTEQRAELLTILKSRFLKDETASKFWMDPYRGEDIGKWRKINFIIWNGGESDLVAPDKN